MRWKPVALLYTVCLKSPPLIPFVVMIASAAEDSLHES